MRRGGTKEKRGGGRWRDRRRERERDPMTKTEINGDGGCKGVIMRVPYLPHHSKISCIHPQPLKTTNKLYQNSVGRRRSNI